MREKLANKSLLLCSFLLAGAVENCKDRTSEYESILVFQLNWNMESEHIVDKNRLLKYFSNRNDKNFKYVGRINYIKNRTEINSIDSQLKVEKTIKKATFNNIRMMCLLTNNKQIDTLFINKDGRATFKEKSFLVDSTLAYMLKLSDFRLNPKYYRYYMMM